jgi:hypothetical protein
MGTAGDLHADVNDAWERAHALAAAGRVDEAYELLAGYAEEALPPGAAALRGELRRRVLARLASLFPPESVLRRVVPPDMRTFPLRAQDMYVFGLLQQEIALGDMLAISPLDELDSLRVVAKLVELGLVMRSAPAGAARAG